MMPGRARHLVVLLTVLMSAMPAAAADPDVPPGRDPGGTAVALISKGIDYTAPAIASRLARDGEGELIGWDFAGNDPRPFGQNGEDAIAGAVIRASRGQRWILVRADAERAESLASALAFIARTPAKAAVLTVGPLPRAAWEPFRSAALQLPHISISVPECAASAGLALQPSAEAAVSALSLGLPNVAAVACPIP
jgi:hypothetical protein